MSAFVLKRIQSILQSPFNPRLSSDRCWVGFNTIILHLDLSSSWPCPLIPAENIQARHSVLPT